MTDQPLQPEPGDDTSGAPPAAAAKRLGEKYQDRVVACWFGGSAALLIGWLMIAGPSVEGGERFLGFVVMVVGLLALLLAIVATGARWGSHIADEDRRRE